jgi:hypothetical protein
MALKYLSHLETLNIDMQGYELQNAVIHTLTTATRPGSPTAGQIIYNSSTGSLEVFDGSGWVSASGDITAVTVSSGTGLTGSASGTSGAVSGTISLDYAGTNNFIDSATDLEGTDVSLEDTIVYHDATDNNVKKGLVSDLPFSNNSGTVTSVAASGSGGVTISGSPITTSGTIAIGLSNVPNSSLANDSVTITAGKGLQDGGVVALGGSVTLNVDYLGTDNVILASTDSRGVPVQPDWSLLISNNDSGDAEHFLVGDLPFTASTGTVTSVAIAGTDGIDVDSGSPITTSGTITLGLSNVPNSSLANNDVTFGSTTVALGGTSTSIAGLTELDFVAGNRTIGASIGANSLTLAGGTSTVVIPGNLTVNGTTTTVNSNNVNIGDAIITLNSDETGAPSQNAGFEVERGTSANVSLVWDETIDRWDFGASYDVRANAFIGDLEGNADTASAWATARTITLGGDASGSVSIDGSANVTLTVSVDSVQANSVALGTDTTGNYVATATGSNGISVTGSGSETAAITISGDNATTSAKGVVELATSAEAITGTDTSRAVTPKAASDMVANRQAAMRVNDVIPAGALTQAITHGFGSTFGVSAGAAAPIILSYFDTVTGEQLMIDSVQVTIDDVEARLAAPHANDIFVSVMYAGA